MERKRILILSASIGSGHDQVATCLEQGLKTLDSKVEIKVLDFMEMLNTPVRQLIKGGYFKMIDLVPNWYHYLYHRTMSLRTGGKVTDFLMYGYEKKMYRLLAKEQTDMIIFTNPFPLVLAAGLKRKHKIHLPISTVITDYTAHGVWVDAAVDNYYVGCRELKALLVSQGVNPQRISVTGIPIHEKFYQEAEPLVFGQQEPAHKKPTLLMMGGGEGLGPLTEMLASLESISRSLRLLVVAGKNVELVPAVEKMAAKSHHEIHVYGFTKEIHRLMAASDLLISKAGGVTMTEAISKALPVLIVQPIPGQEVANARFLTEKGMAQHITRLEQLAPMVETLLFDRPDLLKGMSDQARALSLPHSALTIAAQVLDQIDGPYQEKISL